MTQQQFIEEIKQLSVAERLALIETISRSLREEIEPNAEDAATAEEATSKAFSQNGVEIKSAAVRRLYGSLKFEGQPQTKEEERDAIANYLVEKYS